MKYKDNLIFVLKGIQSPLGERQYADSQYWLKTGERKANIIWEHMGAACDREIA